MQLKYWLIFFIAVGGNVIAQDILITNITNRNTIALNGKWQSIIDPYETGFLDYRFEERNPKDKEVD